MDLLTTAPEHRRQHVAKRPRARVLELDPELGNALEPEQWRPAADAATAPVFRHERGEWRFFPTPDRASFGALVLGGLILVRLEVGGRAHLELLGEGDLVSPWTGVDADLPLPTIVTARVVADVRLALLDRRFAVRTAAWPEIHVALMHRSIARARRLSLQSAINSLPRIDERVELTLWQLAERFGRVTPGGVKLHLRLTHSQFAEMVAAQRPSVSVALARLSAAGRVLRRDKDQWLLCGPPPSKLSPLAERNGLSA